jgi:hypothetical protein
LRRWASLDIDNGIPAALPFYLFIGVARFVTLWTNNTQ